MAGLLPNVYYPRCKVILDVLIKGSAPVPVTATYSVIPRSVTVERNSAREADVARVELDYSDFPLDPRSVQSMQVAVHMGSTLTANSPFATIKPPLPGANAVFLGLVDLPTSRLGSADQRVTLEARDYTGIWLDQKWPTHIAVPGSDPVPSLPTPPKTPLSAIVANMWSQVVPLTKPPIFVSLNPASATQVAAQDVSKRTGKAAFASEDDDNAWDVLSALCDMFGVVPVYNLDQLEIRTASNPTTQSRLFGYGHNVESIEFKRDLRRRKAKQVKVTAWNPAVGESFSAVWPTDAAVMADPNATKLDSSGKPKGAIEQTLYNAPDGNVTTVELLEVAQAIHAEMAQHELTGEMATREMRDTLSGDVTTLANADILLVDLLPSDIAAISGMSPGEAVAALSNPTKPNALSPLAAGALVDSWNAAQLSSQFYVLEAHHHWDREQGYDLKVKFRDFILGV